jgi:acetylornithine deacetylase/succinyl-diaminopimelate desuccinylase-like protein
MGSVDGDHRRRVELLQEAVAIPSVNPLQVGPRSGPGGEIALAEWLAEQAAAAGAEVELDEVLPGRPNVCAHLPGSERRRVMVDVHLDTVGVEHMTGDPFDGRVADGRVYGRGAVDCKATLAVLLPLLLELADLDPDDRPSIYLVGTIGEEAGGLPGAYRLRQWAQERGLRFDAVVVAEPTRCHPVHGHKGGVGLEVTVRGATAHSSKPDQGANAIEGAARIVATFVDEHERLINGPAPTPVGTGTLSVTEISGGLARNIIPDRCRLHAGRRIAPGEDPEEVFNALAELARQAAAPLPVEVTMVYGRGFPAFYQEASAPLVTELAALAGAEPETATYGSNALAYAPITDQLVVFGPGSIDQAHKAEEWIEIGELNRAADIYRRWLHGS